MLTETHLYKLADLMHDHCRCVPANNGGGDCDWCRFIYCSHHLDEVIEYIRCEIKADDDCPPQPFARMRSANMSVDEKRKIAAYMGDLWSEWAGIAVIRIEVEPGEMQSVWHDGVRLRSADEYNDLRRRERAWAREPSLLNVACPVNGCKGELIEADPGVLMLSDPPMKGAKCVVCGHTINVVA